MKKISIVFCLLFLLFGVQQGFAVGGADSLYRISLNGMWKFKTDPYNMGLDSGWYRDNTSLANWDSMDVPGNWDVRNEYADYAGKAWYRTEFSMEKAWDDKNVRLYFESVYYDAEVWVNGQKIGENHLGFLPFFFDISRYLKSGEKNTITVLADNTFKRGALWNWGGIRRPVFMEITDKSRLEYEHITASPDLSKGTAQIDLSFGLNNLGLQNDDHLRIEWELSRDGKVVWNQKAKGSFGLAANENKVLDLSAKLPSHDVVLWNFNHPVLYTSVVKLYRGDVLIHTLSDRFGIRKISVEGEQLKLNGEPIRMVGFNLVPDDRTSGNTLPLWRFMEDVDLMKSMGANMARLSHLPLPREALDYLDEKGILVFEEVSLWGKDAMVDPGHPVPKEWLSRMIKDQYNHPGIIGWSVGNEIGSLSNNPHVLEYVQGAIRQAKQEDPSRLAVYVSHSADWQKVDPAQFSDMILLNKYGKWGENAEKTHQNQPGKPIFYSEYGTGIASEDPNLGVIDAKRMLDEMRQKSYLMGGSLWTFNDYRSKFSGTPISQNRSWGVVNVLRQKKRAYFDFQREYAPVKAIELLGTDSLRIIPRDRLDIPAYTLRDFRVVWEAKDTAGKLLDGGFSKLRVIHPGDLPITQTLRWHAHRGSFSSLKVSLLDPLGYAVLDTTVFFAVPKQPEIINVLADAKSVRVIFKKDPSATSWKVRYKGQGEAVETAETIDNFVNIPDLASGTYTVQVIARNNKGESVPSMPESIQTGINELPPVVWGLEPTDGGFFISYTVDARDYRYQVQFGTKSGDYEHFRMLQFGTAGMARIPGLRNGQTYYVRMRRLMEWGYASDWSQELKIIPGLEAVPPVPFGAIREGEGAVLAFRPAERAIGYQITATDKQTNRKNVWSVNGSQLGYIVLEGLAEKHDYSFDIATVMPEGISSAVSF